MINENSFKPASECAQSIAETNERYAQLLADPLLADQPAFRRIAEEAIRQEQGEQFARLQQMDLTVYDQMAVEQSEAVQAVAAAEEQVRHAQRTVAAEQGRYGAILTALKKYAPRSEGKAVELANEQLSTRAESILAEPQADLAAQQANLANIDELYVSVGQAWPVPVLVDRQPARIESEAIEEASVVEGMQTPLEPIIIRNAHEQPVQASAVETSSKDAANEREIIAADHELVKRIEAGKIARYVSGDGAERWQAHLVTLPEDQHNHAILAISECLDDSAAADRELYDRFHKLVRHITNKVHATMPPGPGLEADDVYQLGWEFLLEQVARYAETMPDRPLRVQIANYMDKSIRARAYQELYAISLPPDMNMKVGQVIRTNQERINHRRPIMSDEDIAELTGFPVHYGRGRQRTVGDIHNAIRQTRLMGSLDRSLSPGADFSLGDSYTIQDILIDPDDEDEAFMRTAQSLLSKQLEAVLQTLSEREAGVIRLRFGLVDGKSRTQEEVGQIFNVKKERIRQIESKTMSKLRHRSRSSVLEPYAYPDADIDRAIRLEQAKILADKEITREAGVGDDNLSGHSKRYKDTLCSAAETQVRYWLGHLYAPSPEPQETLEGIAKELDRVRSENDSIAGQNYDVQEIVSSYRKQLRRRLDDIASETDAQRIELELNNRYIDLFIQYASEKKLHAQLGANKMNDFNAGARYGWNYVLERLFTRLR